LVIDLDPQGNASTALGIDHFTGTPSVYEVIIEGHPLADVTQQCEAIPGLLCAPATIDLAGAEIELVSLVAREGRLRKALQDYSQDVDYIFIDCPPSLGLLTINALVAAAELLIPIQCEYYAMEGLGQLLKNVDLVKAHLNPHLAISTILLTMYDARTRLASQVADEVRQHFEGVVLRTTIPRSVRVSEAPSYGQTVITYDPASTGALAYIEAAREIAADGKAGFAPPMARTSFESAGRASVNVETTSRPHLESDANHPTSSRSPADSATWAGAPFSPVQNRGNDAGTDEMVGEAGGWDTEWTSARSSRSSHPEEGHQ
jgi:chromosome partitioning protein